MKPIVVSAMYKFVSLPHYERLRNPLLQFMLANNIYGTLLLAKEGINGTVAGSAQDILALHEWLEQQPGLDGIGHKESYHAQSPFKRAKVKLKKEIVTMGGEGVDPLEAVGTYVKPDAWNALIVDVSVMLYYRRICFKPPVIESKSYEANRRIRNV